MSRTHRVAVGQIHRLEAVLGEKLFVRSGRNLVLTDSGRIAFRYADEIFSLGQEFQDTLKGRSSGQPLRAGPGTPVRTFSHPLGECGSSFFAASKLARTYRKRFPGWLDGAPVIVPGSDSTFRRALDEWFRSRKLRPEIVAELDDLALASVLAEKGLGVLAAPDVIAKELRQRYALQLVGSAKDIRQRFFAISVERKIKNPAVAAIRELARKKIFA